jgi:hypothetical protein
MSALSLLKNSLDSVVPHLVFNPKAAVGSTMDVMGCLARVRTWADGVQVGFLSPYPHHTPGLVGGSVVKSEGINKNPPKESQLPMC